jgi:hypothetical protein
MYFTGQATRLRMTSSVQTMDDWNRDPWRYLMWIVAGGLVLVAALATEEIRQGEYARVILAALFGAGCAIVELGVRKSAGWAYTAGLIVAVLTGLGQAYMNVVAGLIGSPDNPFNLMFFLIVALTLTGSLLVQGRAPGMVWVMGAAALAQVAAGVVGGMMVPGDRTSTCWDYVPDNVLCGSVAERGRVVPRRGPA